MLPRTSGPDELCTVDDAAAHLRLHPKTVLRHIREGRLRAARIGKAYRIRRADLDAFAGVPPSEPAGGDEATPAPAHASVTTIVDVPGVGPELAQKWGRAVTNALRSKPQGPAPLRAEVVYDPERALLKIVTTGAPGDTSNLLGLVQVWAEQLTP